MFPGIQRFKGKELIPSSVPHRRNLTFLGYFYVILKKSPRILEMYQLCI